MRTSPPATTLALLLMLTPLWLKMLATGMSVVQSVPRPVSFTSPPVEATVVP
jgi:hypothetical protein